MVAAAPVQTVASETLHKQNVTIEPPPRPTLVDAHALAPPVGAVAAEGPPATPDAPAPVGKEVPAPNAPTPKLASAFPETPVQAGDAGINTSAPEQAAIQQVDHGPVDHKRLDLARNIVAKLLPPGQYRTLMAAVMEDTTTNLVKQMQEPALAQSLSAIGMLDGQTESLKTEDVIEAVEILDPTYHRRVSLSTQVVSDGVLDVASRLEPQIREALANSYARNFDKGQLNDILHFFDTSTGAAYASHVMLMTADPAVKALSEQVMQSVMRAMPGIMEEAREAVAGLPQPRDLSTLSDGERERVSKLLRMALSKQTDRPGEGP